MMKKIYLMILFVWMIMLAGCTNDDQSDTCPHKESVQGKIIELRDNNEILIEVIKEESGYNTEDIILIGYSEYSCKRPKDKYDNSPKINHMVSVSFWPEEIEEKDGYAYLPDKQVEVIKRNLYGKIIEVKDNNEILIEVIKNQDEYKKGDIILIGYSLYYSVKNNDTYGAKNKETPKYNDRVILNYWNEDVGQKEGYAYISDIQVQKK